MIPKCKFSFTKSCNKLVIISEFLYLVYAIIFALLAIDIFTTRFFSPETNSKILCITLLIMLLSDALLGFYKIKCISAPKITTISHIGEVDRSAIVAKLEHKITEITAVAESWRDFALNNEKHRIKCLSGAELLSYLLILIYLLINEVT